MRVYLNKNRLTFDAGLLNPGDNNLKAFPQQFCSNSQPLNLQISRTKTL